MTDAEQKPAEQFKIDSVDAVARLKAKTRDEYRQLVLAMACGDDPGDVDLQAILFVTGKTFESLQADVTLLQERKAIAEALELLKGSESELAQVASELEAAKSEAERVSREFQETMAPLIERQEELGRLRNALRSTIGDKRQRCALRLKESCDPAIQQQVHAIQRDEISPLLREINKIQQGSPGRNGCRWDERKGQRLQYLTAAAASGQLSVGEQKELAELKRIRSEVDRAKEYERRIANLQEKIEQVVTAELQWDCVDLFSAADKKRQSGLPTFLPSMPMNGPILGPF